MYLPKATGLHVIELADKQHAILLCSTARHDTIIMDWMSADVAQVRCESLAQLMELPILTPQQYLDRN